MEQTLTTKGFVNLEMKNVTEPELQKLTDYFTQLIDLQIHRFKNGKIILHFDSEGLLQKIETIQISWKRQKGDKTLDKEIDYRL